MKDIKELIGTEIEHNGKNSKIVDVKVNGENIELITEEVKDEQ